MKTYFSQADLGMDARTSALKSDFLNSLPSRIERLHQSWDMSRTADIGIQATLELASNLAGNATIFGCPELSVIAREIKYQCLLLHENQIDEESANRDIGRLFTELQSTISHSVSRALKVARQTSSDHQQNDSLVPSRPVIHVFYHDITSAGELIYYLTSTGYQVEIYDQFEQLSDAVQAQQPDVIIFGCEDGMITADMRDSLHTFTHIQHIPLIITGPDDNHEARLCATRLGACHYFTNPPNLPVLIHTLDRLTSKLTFNRYRAYLIDDHSSKSQAYRGELQNMDVDITCQNRPEQAIAEISEAKPDVIVINDLDASISSAELASLIRQNDELELIPIVFIGAVSQEHNRFKAYFPGINVVLDNVDSPGVLARAIKVAAENARFLQDTRTSLRMATRHLEFMHNVVDAHAIVTMTDLDGNITYVNRKFIEISGYSAYELLGQNHRIFKSGLHDEAFYQNLWRTISSGNVWHGNLTNRDKGGRLYDVSTTIVPRLDDSGKPDCYVAILTDITRIKNLQRQVTEDADRISLALDATQSGMWEWNLNNNQVIYGSSWLKLMGYENHEKISWPMLIHADDLNKVISRLMNHLDGQSDMYVSEHRLLTGDGSWHWVRESGRIIEVDESGAPMRLIGTTQFIDDRIALEEKQRALQEKLLHAAKMESLGQLTAGIAHDFNNLLGAILGFTELSMELADVQDEKADIKKYLSQVLAAGTRAKELISQMLLYSRVSPDSGIEMAPECTLKHVITEVTHLAQSTIPSGINVNFQVEQDELKGHIQPVHLHQILLNLVLNARDELGEFGNITISLSQSYFDRVCQSCHHNFSGDYVEIRVHDDGNGIPPENLHRIFEPFYTTKDVGKGSGMGLSVIHGIVHGLNGHVHVESSSREGTTFSIYLPACEKTQDNPTEFVPALVNRDDIRIDGIRIMVIDDEIAISSMLAEFIEMYGGKVTVHNKPDRAVVDFIRRPHDFDLMITDATMPGLSGIELARAVLQLRPELPILMCTGYSNYVNEDIARRNGIAGFMQKPIEFSRILEWIQTHSVAPANRAEGT